MNSAHKLLYSHLKYSKGLDPATVGLFCMSQLNKQMTQAFESNFMGALSIVVCYCCSVTRTQYMGLKACNALASAFNLCKVCFLPYSSWNI